MRLKKAANLIFTACFLAFLAGGMLVTAAKPKQTVSYFENRLLAPVPRLTRAGFLDGSWFTGWEDFLKDHAAGRETLLRASTYIDLFVLHRPVANGIIVADGVFLLLSQNSRTPAETAALSGKMADSILSLSKAVEDYGGRFYYVAVPDQTYYFRDRCPEYLRESASSSGPDLRQLKADLSSRGVSFIDIGEVFDGLGHPDGMYYATDHHCTFDGALEIYSALMGRINADTGLGLPVISPGDLSFKELPNPFLGSYMRKLFGLPGTDEKLKIGLPKAEVPFARTDDGKPSAPTVYALPESPLETVTYSVYMGGDIGETVIETNRPDLPDVLICGDSYTNAVECLLYLSFDEMRSVDLRHCSEMPLTDYVSLHRPDIVILLRDYSVLLSFDGNGKVT